MRLFAILVGLVAATSAIAHPGGLAADGCHNDRKNGGRHATARREDRHLRLIARSERWAATSISLIAQWRVPPALPRRSEAHTSELQSLMRISYAVFCLNIKLPLIFLSLFFSLFSFSLLFFLFFSFILFFFFSLFFFFF